MSSARTAAAAAALFFLSASPALAQPAADPAIEARAHYERGVGFLQAGQPAEATVELERAFQLAPTNEILWTWAQAERLSGDCARAIELYGRFLTEYPEGDQSGPAARGFIAACEATLASQRVSEFLDSAGEARLRKDWSAAREGYESAALLEPKNAPARVGLIESLVELHECERAAGLATALYLDEPAHRSRQETMAKLASCKRVGSRVAPPTSKLEVSSGGDPPSRWYQSKLGWALVGAGAAAAGIGAALAIEARSTALDPGAVDYDQHLETFNAAQRRYWIGIGVGGAAAMALTAGIIRFATHEGPEAPTAAVTPTAGGGTLSLSGRF